MAWKRFPGAIFSAIFALRPSTVNVPVDQTTPPTTPAATATPTAAPVASGNTAGIAVGISFAIIVLVVLVVMCLFVFCGRERLKFYKKHCGGVCFICCSKTHSCMSVTKTNCCSCLSWTKLMVLRCYDCCCDECSQGQVEPSPYDQESTVVIDITPPHDEVKGEKGNEFLPLPPSVEEVDKVDSKGNPRRLPPIESPRIQATIMEEEEEEVPQTAKLPPIASTSPFEESQRTSSPVVQLTAESDPHVPEMTKLDESAADVPDAKMNPEGKVSEIQLEEPPVLPVATPPPSEQIQGVEHTTVVQVEVEPVQEEPVTQETPAAPEASVAHDIPSSQEQPALPQDPATEVTALPQEDPVTQTLITQDTTEAEEPTVQSESGSGGAQEQVPQQTTVVREVEPGPILHSTPREVEGTET